jgi:Co/Zn/Cd efflux system component
MFMSVITLASLVIWITASQELIKPSEKQNKQKIIMLTSAGTLTTAAVTISLFQSLPF